MNKTLEKWYVWDEKSEEPKPNSVKSVLQKGARGSFDTDDARENGFTWINWSSIAIYTLGEKVESKRGKDDN